MSYRSADWKIKLKYMGKLHMCKDEHHFICDIYVFMRPHRLDRHVRLVFIHLGPQFNFVSSQHFSWFTMGMWTKTTFCIRSF